jgi:putative DNA primase/helicase
MRGNSHVRFLGGGVMVTSPCYPTPKDRKLTGSAIRLIETGPILAVTEGLETALAVIEGTGLPVWCAGNAYLLEHFVPPKGVEKVFVFADKDRPTSTSPKGAGQEAAVRLIRRLWETGIKASAFIPPGAIPPSQKSLDWLDVLNGRGIDGFPLSLRRSA